MMANLSIKTIIVMMSVALVGLVGIQGYWIQNAIVLREQRFNSAVSEAMNQVVYRYEKYKAAKKIALQMDIRDKRSTLISQMDSINQAIMLNRDSILSLNEEQPVFYAPQPHNPQIEINVYEEFLEDSAGFLVKRSQQQTFSSPTFSFPPMREPTMLDAESHRKQRLRDSLEMVSRHNLEWLEKRTELVNELFEELVSVDLFDNNDGLDTIALDSIIGQELADKGIDTEFAFGVFDPFMQAVYLRGEDNHIDGVVTSEHRVNLFPGNVFAPPKFLSVYFPHEQGFLLQTMWILLTISGIFILLIIFTFGYSVNTIIRQKKLSEIKNDFINNMTHELKTPISTISLACQALTDPDMIKRQGLVDNYVKVISDENKRLGMVVESVLRTAVIDKGELKLKMQEVNVHQAIDNVVNNMNLKVNSQGGQILERLHSSNPNVMADKIHLTNVIFNLVDNALKYTKEVPIIKIGTEGTAEGVIISVEDNGIGITKEHQKKVFEKLYRVPTGNVHDVKGFGLGLSYVKAIMDKHGGWAKVKSELNKGSRFEIFIPYKPVKS
ncbi:MAG: two-component system phosphate regulon sensor histidine kinase PhoR [Granulosicoccus sp.]